MPDDRIQDEPDRPRRPRDDDEDERPRRRRVRRDEDEDEGGGAGSLIPYKNPQALIAYYLGVFALIPCFGALLAVGSIILGILGLKYVGKHPTSGGTGHAWAGIVLGTLVLLGHAGVGIFIAVINAK